MKIEAVREKQDPVKKIIDDGLAIQILFSKMKHGLNIELMLGIKPDFDLLARCIAEVYRERVELTDMEYEELLEILNNSMPDIYKDFMIRCKGRNNSREYRDKINWKRIEKLLPASYEDEFSIDPMINYKTQLEMIKILKTVELYLQSGMMLLSIISKSKINREDIQPDANLFRKIILTNIVLKTPEKMSGMIENLLDTEDLADMCLSLLNKHYNQKLTIGIGILGLSCYVE